MPNPACVAYEAYRKHWNENPTSTSFMVAWQYLPDDEKKAWWSVVGALSKLLTDAKKESEK